MRIPKRISLTRTFFISLLKIAILVCLYILISIYTIPAYKAMKTFVEEKFVTNTKVIIIGDSAVTVEIANTYEERILGLSGRESLAPNNGMFFVFDEPDTYGIWMKDMKFNLDIIWLDQFGEIIHIKENIAPDTYPTTFVPDKPALYVLEVPAGFVQEKHLELGDRIDFY